MKILAAVLFAAIWIFAAGFACGTMNAPQVTPNECVVQTHNTGVAFDRMVEVEGREMVRGVGGIWCVRQSRID